MTADPRRRKRAVSLYLRDDIVQAIERVAIESNLNVSRVAEVLLGFQLEMGRILENENFLLDLHRRLHRTA